MDRKANPSSTADWVIRSTTPGSVERIEAWFGGHGYDPHRHDTYSIGRTLAGVQSFHYKGALCHGVPGNTLVLHPDAVGGKPRGRKRLDYRSAERARAFIMEHLHVGITLEMLEQASGREQWSLSRDFRALYGTSPYRFVTLRRLDCFRRLILDGFTLVDAALAAGFHDQSHMTRHFTRTYGVPPLRWLERLRATR